MEPKLLTAERFVDQQTGCSYRYVYSDTEYFRPHYHDYFEIFLILDGSAVHKINGAEIPLSRGSLVLIRPADCHDYVSRDGQRFSMLNITFTRETADQLFSYLGEGFPSKILLEQPLPPEVRLTEPELNRIQKRMASLRAIVPQDHDRRKTGLRILLFDILTRQFSEFEQVQEPIPVWLEEMCTEIKRNGNFIQGTSYFFGLTDRSREHVTRTLKKYTGMTPSELINDLRLNYVANMLCNSNHSVTELIFASGFNNISWASTLFRRKYHMTMMEYRKQAKL